MPKRCDNKDWNFLFTICSKEYPNSQHNIRLCVCVYLCVRKREREGGREGERVINAYSG